MKKIYTVHRNCYATIDVDVVAESEEEALRIADSRFDVIPASEYDFEENSTEIIDEAPLELSDDMIESAVESIRKEVKNDGDAVSFESVEVHYDMLEMVNYRECDTVEHTVYVDSAYVDEDDNLWIQDEDCEHEDFELDNFNEVDQMKIINAILNRK